MRVSCDVVGGRPFIAPQLAHIAARVGLDRHPVEATADDECRWLLACIWPDTGDRLERTRAALSEARQTPPEFVPGDAVEAVLDVVLGLPAEVAAVVTTTWALVYLEPERRIAFRAALADASHQRTIAWISGESPGIVDLFADVEPAPDSQGMLPSVLGLTVFRDGALDTTLLALVHPHGNWIDWRA